MRRVEDFLGTLVAYLLLSPTFIIMMMFWIGDRMGFKDESQPKSSCGLVTATMFFLGVICSLGCVIYFSTMKEGELANIKFWQKENVRPVKLEKLEEKNTQIAAVKS